jgi:hypothetical protein
MALDVDTLRTDLVSDMETHVPGFSNLDAPTRASLRDGLAQALSVWLHRALTEYAEVSFTAGQLTGSDSGGDTPISVVAAGGKIT